MEKSDEKLYQEAEARIGFKRHLSFYIAMNILVWAVWYFTSGMKGHYAGFWPVWTTLGWGIGIAAHYIGVYVKSDSAVEREFQKLKEKQKGGMN